MKETLSGHILDSGRFVRICSVLQSLKRSLYLFFGIRFSEPIPRIEFLDCQRKGNESATEALIAI